MVNLFDGTRLTMAACVALIVLFVVLSVETTDGYALREPKEHAIKRHIDDETRILLKREADEEAKKEKEKEKNKDKDKDKSNEKEKDKDKEEESEPKKAKQTGKGSKKSAKSTTAAPAKGASTSTSTTSTTQSPTSGKPAGGKAKSKAKNKKGSKTTTTTTEKTTDIVGSSSTTPASTSTSTRKPADGEEEISETLKKANRLHALDTFPTLDQLQHEERDALDMALAGLKAWMRLLEKADRTYNRIRAGKYLHFVQKLINMRQIRKEGKDLIQEFHEAEYDKEDSEKGPGIMSGFGNLVLI